MCHTKKVHYYFLITMTTATEKRAFFKSHIDCITEMVKTNAETSSEFYYEFMQGCEPTPADYEAVSEPLFQTLTVSQGHNDWQNDFKVRVGSPRLRKGVYAPTGEKRVYDMNCIWNVSLHLCDGKYVGINAGACISSSYSREERMANRRMYNLRPIAHGDKVIINGDFYIAKVNGNYSNCIEFHKVEVI